MARQEDQLVKVLTLIDESLIDLKEGSKHQQSLGQPSSNVTTSYLNTLTRDLLEEQKQNSALAEENQLLRRRLEMQSGTHSQLSSAVGGGSDGGGGSGGGGARSNLFQRGRDNSNYNFADERTKTLSECIEAINKKVDEQAEILRSKQVDGMCTLAHVNVQASLDRCTSQLQQFREGELVAKEQRNSMYDNAERDRDRLAAAMLEIQHLQGERRGMEERLEAFELENMRLTNALQRERERTSGASNEVNVHLEELSRAMAKNQAYEKENESLRSQNYRLVNEVDEARNMRNGGL